MEINNIKFIFENKYHLLNMINKNFFKNDIFLSEEQIEKLKKICEFLYEFDTYYMNEMKKKRIKFLCSILYFKVLKIKTFDEFKKYLDDEYFAIVSAFENYFSGKYNEYDLEIVSNNLWGY